MHCPPIAIAWPCSDMKNYFVSLTTDRDFHATVIEMPSGLHPDLAAAFLRAHGERRTRYHPTLVNAFAETKIRACPAQIVAQIVEEFPQIAPWRVVSVPWAVLRTRAL